MTSLPGSACRSFKACMAMNLREGACCPSPAGIRWGGGFTENLERTRLRFDAAMLSIYCWLYTLVQVYTGSPRILSSVPGCLAAISERSFGAVCSTGNRWWAQRACLRCTGCSPAGVHELRLVLSDLSSISEKDERKRSKYKRFFVFQTSLFDFPSLNRMMI